jgi:hypothetical protein
MLTECPWLGLAGSCLLTLLTRSRGHAGIDLQALPVPCPPGRTRTATVLREVAWLLVLRRRRTGHGGGEARRCPASKLYAELLAQGVMHGKPLSATTVRLVHRVLSKSFEDAVEARLVAARPARRLKVPRPGRREIMTQDVDVRPWPNG